MWDSAGSDFHGKEDVEAAQPDGVEGEEVGGQQPGGLGAQEGPPAGVCAAWCRPRGRAVPGSAGSCRRPRGARARRVRLGGGGGPGGIFLCQAQHQVADLSLTGGRNVEQVVDFPKGLRPIQVDDTATTMSKMGRPALRVRVDSHGTALDVVSCHLKPKLLSFPGDRFNPKDEGLY